MKGSFADNIRKIVRELGAGGADVPIDAIFERMGIALYKTKRPVYGVLSDLKRAGDIRRVKRGVYAWGGKTAPLEIRQGMWKVLRCRRTVTVEDLMELAAVSESYAREWLTALMNRAVVRRTDSGHYRIINDPVTMPDLDDNAQKLREIRRRKKAALKSLQDAQYAITEARTLLENDLQKMEG